MEIKKRFSQAITPTHLVANLLHPGYQGKHLSIQQQEEAHQYVLNSNPDLLPGLLQLQANTSPFPSSLFSPICINSLKPTACWEIAKASKNYVSYDLCNYAVKLHKLPSSSAAIERMFSNFGLIQSKLRNHLGLVKAAKLVTCYRYLHGCNEPDW